MKTKRRTAGRLPFKVAFLLAILFGISVAAGCGNDDVSPSEFCPDVCGSYASANTAHDVVAADLDEDGNIDLAVIGHLPVNPEEGLVILKGDGKGGFTHMQSLQVGDHNHGVIAVDVNQDGHLDVVTTTAARAKPRYDMHVVHVFLGDGAGEFIHEQWKIEDISTGLLDARAGDLNNDGFVDLILSGVPPDQVMVLFGKGNGEFELPGVRFGRAIHTRMSVVGDFNADGDLDVAVTNAGWTVGLLLGDGQGNLDWAGNFFVGSGPRSIRMADFDKDGNLDITVTTRMGNGASIILGDGKGSFFGLNHIKTGEDPRELRAGYLNDDDVLDVAVANALSQTVSFLYGDGEGAFLMKEDVRVGNAPVLTRQDKPLIIPGFKESGTGDGIVGLEIADVDGDGREDVIASSTYDGQVYLLWSRCIAQP
jgi:FG-GAP-like repeat